MIDKLLELLKELSDQSKKIMLIEHNIETVRSICDWLIVMDDGKKIAEGVPDEVLQKDEIIEAYLD
jgi:ABC-type branched-subunit amino acid transport system ATPase component